MKPVRMLTVYTSVGRPKLEDGRKVKFRYLKLARNHGLKYTFCDVWSEYADANSMDVKPREILIKLRDRLITSPDVVLFVGGSSWVTRQLLEVFIRPKSLYLVCVAEPKAVMARYALTRGVKVVQDIERDLEDYFSATQERAKPILVGHMKS